MNYIWSLKNYLTSYMKKLFLILILSAAQFLTLAQDKQFQFEFLPEGMHFLPLRANYQEAHMGIMYYPSNANLKVDIGNSMDVLGFHFGEDIFISVGAEFMAYGLSTSFGGNRLQIDALDGFFGGNASLSINYSETSKLIGRFRIIHNSAHLVDGSYLKDSKTWKNNYEPIPYTEDFGELIVGHEFLTDKILTRYYGLVSYSTLVRPSNLKKWVGGFGFESAYTKIFSFLNKDANLFAAYHFNLDGTSEYEGNNSIKLGIKFGEWHNKGVSFYLSYYSGRNPFSEFYFQKVNRFGLGFLFEFI